MALGKAEYNSTEAASGAVSIYRQTPSIAIIDQIWKQGQEQFAWVKSVPETPCIDVLNRFCSMWSLFIQGLSHKALLPSLGFHKVFSLSLFIVYIAYCYRM